MEKKEFKTAEEIYRDVHNKYDAMGGNADKYDLEAMRTYAAQEVAKVGDGWVSVETELPPLREKVLLKERFGDNITIGFLCEFNWKN